MKAACIRNASGRSQQCAVARPSKAPHTQRRSLSVARSSNGDTPQNVLEARAWIAAWQSKQLVNGVEATEHNHVIAATHHEAHDQRKAAPAAKANNVVPTPSAWGTVQLDGTVVFSAKQLQDSTQTAAALKRVRSGAR